MITQQSSTARAYTPLNTMMRRRKMPHCISHITTGNNLPRVGVSRQYRYTTEHCRALQPRHDKVNELDCNNGNHTCVAAAERTDRPGSLYNCSLCSIERSFLFATDVERMNQRGTRLGLDEYVLIFLRPNDVSRSDFIFYL